MKIRLTSVMVDDQDGLLGFIQKFGGVVKKTVMPAGKFKWLTVVSPEKPADVELLLEPNNNPAVRTYQEDFF